jgi:hypothetical protein
MQSDFLLYIESQPQTSIAVQRMGQIALRALQRVLGKLHESPEHMQQRDTLITDEASTRLVIYKHMMDYVTKVAGEDQLKLNDGLIQAEP